MPEIDFTDNLRNSMQKAGFASFKALSLAAGVSPWQILQLRRGKIALMRVEVLVKLSQVLQVSWTELVETFGIGGLYSLNKTQSDIKI